MSLPWGLQALGRWGPEMVQVSWIEEPQRNLAWKKNVRKRWGAIKRAQPFVYDAPLAALQAFKAGECLKLFMSKSSYMTMAATHGDAAWFREHFGEQGLGKGTACALGLLCPEGLMLGRRSRQVHQGQGLWHPIAGHFNPDEHKGARGLGDPFACVLMEAGEEASLTPDQLEDLHLIGVMIHPQSLKPELLFAARTALPMASLDRLRQEAKDRHEIEDYRAFSRPEVETLASEGATEEATLVTRAMAHALLALDLMP